MHDQPAPSTTISPAAAFMLSVSVLAGTALAGLVVAQAVTPVRVYLGTGPLLGAVATLFGGGFLANIAVAKVMSRLDQIDEQVAAQRVTYLPQQPKQNQGVRFLPAAPGAGHRGSVGLDPASIAAAKALARVIVDGPAEARRDAE